jgi:hypothetical protein
MNAYYVYQSAQSGELRPAILGGTGPASYSQATGDVLYNAGSNEYIDFPSECTTVSGYYSVCFRPVSVGNNTAFIRAGAPSASQSGWVARWQYSGLAALGKIVTSAAVTAGSGYTNGTYNITASGGTFTRSAIIQVVVASGAISTATILDAGVYASGSATPTISLTAAGAGAGGAVTLTIGAPTPGSELPTGSVLNGETVQFGALVSQL